MKILFLLMSLESAFAIYDRELEHATLATAKCVSCHEGLKNRVKLGPTIPLIKSIFSKTTEVTEEDTDASSVTRWKLSEFETQQYGENQAYISYVFAKILYKLGATNRPIGNQEKLADGLVAAFIKIPEVKLLYEAFRDLETANISSGDNIESNRSKLIANWDQHHEEVALDGAEDHSVRRTKLIEKFAHFQNLLDIYGCNSSGSIRLDLKKRIGFDEDERPIWESVQVKTREGFDNLLLDLIDTTFFMEDISEIKCQIDKYDPSNPSQSISGSGAASS